jgi:hypothetical protein
MFQAPGIFPGGLIFEGAEIFFWNRQGWTACFVIDSLTPMKPKHWIAEISPPRTSLTSYIFPLGGVILGVVFLHEEFTWQLFLGTLFIIASSGVINWKSRKRIFNKN